MGEIFEMLFGIFGMMALYSIIPIVVIGGLILGLMYAAKKLKTEQPETGERTLIQQDDRITTIYKIRKDDPDFDANEVEQYIKNYTKERYPDIIFRQSGFNIIEYNKFDNKAQIVYSILASTTYGNGKEYKAVVEMDIKGSDKMHEYTKECPNCGAVIENEKEQFCPYCGQSYKFQKYNTWKVKEVVEL